MIEFPTEATKVQIPTQKSTGVSLDKSYVLKEAKELGQPFLWITQVRKQGILLHVNKVSLWGDYFLPEDLEPYQE